MADTTLYGMLESTLLLSSKENTSPFQPYMASIYLSLVYGGFLIISSCCYPSYNTAKTVPQMKNRPMKCHGAVQKKRYAVSY